MHFTLADQSKGSGLAQDKICIVSSSSGTYLTAISYAWLERNLAKGHLNSCEARAWHCTAPTLYGRSSFVTKPQSGTRQYQNGICLSSPDS
jgi:hypothetical protein